MLLTLVLGRILAAGGDVVPGNTIQLYSPNGWYQSSSLPSGSRSGCAVAFNSSTYVIAGGSSYGITVFYDQTFIFNVDANTLLQGPSLQTPRDMAACARIRNPSTGLYNVIVAGGKNSVNILNKLTLSTLFSKS